MWHCGISIDVATAMKFRLLSVLKLIKLSPVHHAAQNLVEYLVVLTLPKPRSGDLRCIMI